MFTVSRSVVVLSGSDSCLFSCNAFEIMQFRLSLFGDCLFKCYFHLGQKFGLSSLFYDTSLWYLAYYFCWCERGCEVCMIRLDVKGSLKPVLTVMCYSLVNLPTGSHLSRVFYLLVCGVHSTAWTMFGWSGSDVGQVSDICIMHNWRVGCICMHAIYRSCKVIWQAKFKCVSRCCWLTRDKLQDLEMAGGSIYAPHIYAMFKDMFRVQYVLTTILYVASLCLSRCLSGCTLASWSASLNKDFIGFLN
jgi:hypothetical protein